jgi:hypothetical protein
MKSLRQLSCLALCGALASAAACAGQADQPLTIAGGFENWRLPGDERMGMAHADVLFQVAPGWWLGPTVYGAASGQRGGFFVGGLAIQRPLAITPGLSLVPALAIGGGGGGGAPVGDGLMVRPSLSLQAPFGPWRVGLGVSEVVFPGTSIRSSQVGLVVEWQGQFVAEPLAAVGRRLSASGRSGLGFDRVELTAGRYSLQGNASSPQVDLVGMRLDRFGSGKTLLWGVEAAAAVNGSSAGYMEILAHGGTEVELADTLQVGARAALGIGGGGAVPTGGGAIGHLDATLRFTPLPGWHLGAAVGRVAGTSSAMRGTRAELTLGTDLEPDGLPGTPGRTGTARRVEWAGAWQQVQSVHRNDGTTESLQTIGLQLNWWLGPNGYLTGQAHSAFSGGAGAYSQGLLGAGIATAAPGKWAQVGVELLAGAGGGGGVQSLSGAMAQAMLWFGWMPWRDGAHARLAVGAETSRGGSLSRVVALSWVVPFGQIVR